MHQNEFSCESTLYMCTEQPLPPGRRRALVRAQYLHRLQREKQLTTLTTGLSPKYNMFKALQSTCTGV